MISTSIHNKILEVLHTKKESSAGIDRLSKIQGGSINEAFRLESGGEAFFLKLNVARNHPGMFEAEAKGLELLRAAGRIAVPAVMGTGGDEKDQFILMEYIIPGSPVNGFDQEFGKELARLHKTSAERFGLDHDNYIGSLKQRNIQHVKWTDFFIHERLLPQLKKAMDTGGARKELVKKFEHLFKRLDDLLPAEPPALLHGDLWSGNYTCGKNSRPWIFDPAVYYGHREMDIAMTRLFGGFGSGFYSGYMEEFSLQKDWEKRVDIFNLYPLMVHANLFGGHYRHDVERILEAY